MPVRDLLVTVIVIASLPISFRSPWIGVLVWSWLAYMNPHRLSWGFAYDMPFAQWVAIATLLGLLFSRDRGPLPRTRETYLLMALWVLFTLSTIFAVYPDLAWPQWEKVSKAFLFTFLALLLFQDRTRLRYLLLTIVLSLGFYALKGGLFAILTGGEHRVIYPDESSMGSNTGLGLALNMALPMFFFVAQQEQNPWLRWLLRTMLIFAIPAIAFTYSRAAFLGLVAVVLFLVLKITRPKMLASASIIAMIVFVVQFAPPQWFARVDMIARYEQDPSAQMRLESWYVFYRVGLDRPFLGAGFWGPTEDALYQQYVPNPLRAQNAHNMFLNVLGEHGVIALATYVTLLLCCFGTLRRMRKRRQDREPRPWIVAYSHMLEVSLVGYIVCGIFLSVAYLELFYTLVAAILVLKVLAQRELQTMPSPDEPTPNPARRPAIQGRTT